MQNWLNADSALLLVLKNYYEINYLIFIKKIKFC